jgi:hypothetical protein
MRAIVFSMACVLFAQDSASNGQFIIAGRVIDATTGAPVARALVTADGGNTVTRGGSVLTEANGSFRIESLPEGGYVVSVRKPGFVVDPDDQPIVNFTLGPSRNDLILRLSPLGAVEGTVRNADGDPMEWITVQALRYSVVRGRRLTTLDRSVTTDDRGRYRLWNLEPGRYLLRVSGRGGTTYTLVSGRSSDRDRESFLPVYFGGSEAAVGATPITIAPGHQARADFSLVASPAFVLRGSLANFTPYAQVKFELTRNGEEVKAGRMSVNSRDGNFAIYDLVPGSYRVRALQGEKENRTIAEREVQVTNSNVDRLVMQLARGFTLSGTVRREAFEDHASEGLILPRRSGGVIQLYSLDRQDSDTFASIEADGHFELKNVLPGNYEFDLTGGGYVASAMSDSVDLLAAKNQIKLPAGEGVAPIEIVVRGDGGRIDAILQVDKLQRNAGVLLTTDAYGTLPQMLVSNGGPHAYFGPLRPGDYTLYLLHDYRETEYANSEVLRLLHGGVKVKVEANQEAKVTLAEFAE